MDLIPATLQSFLHGRLTMRRANDEEADGFIDAVVIADGWARFTLSGIRRREPRGQWIKGLLPGYDGFELKQVVVKSSMPGMLVIEDVQHRTFTLRALVLEPSPV